jgi:predicted dehydrogenase
VKILQIGLGGFGEKHLRVWNELRQEVYAADLSPKRLELCGTYNIPAERRSQDFNDFMDKVDAVDIVVPTDAHATLCKRTIEAGKHVFIEKPITKTAAEAKELVELMDGKDLVLQVGHIFRFNPAVKYIQERIHDGTLGDIRYMRGVFSGFKRCRTDVGVIATDAIHFIDLFNMFMNRAPDSVYAARRDNFGRGLEDLGIVHLSYGPTHAMIEVGNIQPGKHRELDIVGSKATIECNVDAQQATLHRMHHELKAGVWTAVHTGSELPNIVTQEPLYHELKSFVECAEQKKQPPVDARAGYNLIRIVEAAYRSAAEGREVRLE